MKSEFDLWQLFNICPDPRWAVAVGVGIRKGEDEEYGAFTHGIVRIIYFIKFMHCLIVKQQQHSKQSKTEVEKRERERLHYLVFSYTISILSVIFNTSFETINEVAVQSINPRRITTPFLPDAPPKPTPSVSYWRCINGCWCQASMTVGRWSH